MLIEVIEFSLPDTLADFASLAALKARDKGIGFEMKMRSRIPDRVLSDPTRLRQILTNVVGNALKFTERGKVQLDVERVGNKLNFTVRDTGVGLDPDQARQLFQAFQQADVSTTRRYGGTGLGLVLTRKIAETMGGEFTLLESLPNEGSTFLASIAIEIPPGAQMVDSTPIKVIENTNDVAEAERPLNGLRILVIEDSPDNQALFQIMLTKLGARIDLAKDGYEGVNLATSQDFDVVLCDVQMPRMDGYEAMAQLKKRNYAVPVVALTAHAMKEERDRALAAGFRDFLSKPVKRDALIKVVLNQSGKRRGEGPTQRL